MFERDRELVKQELERGFAKFSPNMPEGLDEIYDNIRKAQANCPHVYDDGTDALYVTSSGKRKCRICGKYF